MDLHMDNLQNDAACNLKEDTCFESDVLASKIELFSLDANCDPNLLILEIKKRDCDDIPTNGDFNSNELETIDNSDLGRGDSVNEKKSPELCHQDYTCEDMLNNSEGGSPDTKADDSSSENDVHSARETNEEVAFENVSTVCSEISKKEPFDGEFYRKTGHGESDISDDEDDELSKQPLNENKPVHNKLHPNTTLEWFDNQYQADTVHRLNVFRKSKQFCDLVLLVGGHELYCHRVIVGAGSRAIFDELSRGEQESGPLATIPVDVARSGLVPGAVEILIDYMYTSKLSVPPNLLVAVYRAALQLGVERVTPLCRRYVIANADPDQCIQMRRLAQNYGDYELKDYMDSYIEDNFDLVATTCELLSLPRIKMEIFVSSNANVFNMLSISAKDGVLGSTAMAWTYDQVLQRGGGYLEDLTEQVQRISLEDFNGAASSMTTRCSEQHRLSREGDKRKSIEGGRARLLTRSSSMDSIKSSDSSDASSHISCNLKGEWKVIASTQVSGTDHMISLCCLGDVLCTLSIRLPPLSSSSGDSHEMNGYHNNHSFVLGSSSGSSSSSVGSGSQLTPMSLSRCAAGVAQIGGKIIVAGGFNQMECLDTVESFDPAANQWTMLSRMSERRARFSVAVLNGKLYAIGGSTGTNDLLLVERYDPENDTWTHVQSLLFRCSESGVAVLNDLLYCVGGVQQSSGVAGMKACQIYDPVTDEWSAMAPLHTGRSSLGVAALGGSLYAVAGSDGWQCLGSAEKFDPETDHWTNIATLNVHRRGLGLTEHNDALFCVGGFDGQSFLSSVERYCPSEGDVWTLASFPLSLPRNNVGLVSLNGSIFAVGGFSGRQFLSSIEIVEENIHEWTNQESQTQGGVVNDTPNKSN